MPTYEYICTQCGEPLEIVQSIHEPSLTVCPKCDGKLRKVFGNVGVVFKGSGFYKTDSRSADGKRKKAAGGDSKPGADSGKSGESEKSASPATSSDGKGTAKAGSASPSSAGESSGSTKPSSPAGGSSSSGSRPASPKQG
ncbi:MAG: FmdB family zinc ribbon protein [Actinomycetes bacterium]